MSDKLKPIGKEYTDLEQRKRFLKDNSDAVVEKSYMKKFTPEQLQGFKEDLAECCMETSEIASELKEIKEQFKMRLKPLQERQSELLRNIRQKAELVTEVCYKFVNQDEKMTYFYNEDGDCIEARQCTADELQKTVFQSLRTGTEG